MIIGGGSIFGGYGTIIGALAGAAVITLIRALLSLQIITGPGEILFRDVPQHWVNVIVGFILIIAVLADIWIRQQGILANGCGGCGRPPRRRPPMAEAAVAMEPARNVIEMRDISKAFGAVCRRSTT